MLIPSLDSYFWVVKKPKTLKKLLKLRFLDNFSGAEGEECDQEDWFGIIIPYWATYHLDVVHPFHWKQPPKPLWKVKKLWKLWFSGYFSKAKTEKYDKKREWL